jgi:N-dimethylarginine dimethylaminohydrolase
MQIAVKNETSALESVILGLGIDRGTPRGINPMIRKHLKNNTYPQTEKICREIDAFKSVLEQNGVEVIQPHNLKGTEQMFTRDIGFVIDDYFFISNMKYEIRRAELAGIQPLLDQLPPDKVIPIPRQVSVEGGDVILWDDYIFLGQGARTNREALAFLKNFFPGRTVLGFEIINDQESARRHVLHLDCTFQPIGQDEAIFYEEGFVNTPAELLELFPSEKRIDVSLEEKVRMFPNVFSIAPRKVVVEKSFQRLISVLEERGYTTFSVDYTEHAKLSGLLRCSTLPLKRR